MSFVVAAFYHFFDFPHFAETRQPLLSLLSGLGIKGSLLLAPEGINGTISGSRTSIDQALAYLKTHVTMQPFEHKESYCRQQPFARTKVRLKKEIISFGKPTLQLTEPGQGKSGQKVDAAAWNELLEDPDVTLLDARNQYEVHLGTFQGAINPGIQSFSQLPEFVHHKLNPAQHKKIATFCTGGIRCEKLSAWLVEQGFEEVYQLQGGILKYLETIPEAQSKWQGECYVFDERVAVDHALAPSQVATICPECGYALQKFYCLKCKKLFKNS